jgi:magnesium chelatase subunit D
VGVSVQEDQEQDENEEENEEEEEDPEQNDELPEEFMFNSEGVVMDEDLLKSATSAQKKKGKTGRAKNIIFR